MVSALSTRGQVDVLHPQLFNQCLRNPRGCDGDSNPEKQTESIASDPGPKALRRRDRNSPLPTLTFYFTHPEPKQQSRYSRMAQAVWRKALEEGVVRLSVDFLPMSNRDHKYDQQVILDRV